MTLTGKLNQRHKAALCGTIVSVGLIVALGGRVRVAVGVGLLGIAYAWALGANRRVVHWLFLLSGLLLLSAPVVDFLTWPGVKADLIKAQAQMVNGDKSMIETEERSQHDLASDPSPGVRTAAREGMNDYQEQLFADSTRLSADERELKNLQRETALRHIIRMDWQFIAAGLLLLCSGIGLLAGVRPRYTRATSE